MRSLPLLFPIIFVSLSCSAQINIALLHQLVSESKREHERQSEARDRQATSTLAEELNRSSMNTLKDRYRQISSRFYVLGGAIDALQIGLEAGPVIEDIYRSQSAIISLCRDDPLLIPLALSAQISLADESQMLLRYLYGLALSAGELNQMRQSDRKLLFFAVISQLRSISGGLRGLYLTLRAAKENKRSKQSPFSDFARRDRALIEDILQKSKTLKLPP
jgi:hypothetical protein